MNFEAYILVVVALAIVWNALNEPGEIFDFFPNLVHKLTDNEKVQKVAFACPKCIAGQIALWSFPFLFEYIWLAHLCAVILSIFFAHIASLTIQKYLY